MATLGQRLEKKRGTMPDPPAIELWPGRKNLCHFAREMSPGRQKLAGGPMGAQGQEKKRASGRKKKRQIKT